jgi:hypothetical protein
VILITHIEPVREGVDRVITVRYDADTGSSIVSETEGEPVLREQQGLFDDRPRRREPVEAESIESNAGAGA